MATNLATARAGRRSWLRAAALAALATAAHPFAMAQAYPARQITLVSAFPAGSGADLAARAIAPGLAEVLGQPVVVDNRPGAGGAIGARSVVKAPKDGYTLFAASISFAMMVATTEPGFDAYKDFEPIIMFGTQQLFFVVNPALPVKTLKDLIDWARAHPGELNYGSGGIGSLGHMQGELLKREAGIDSVHVPYKGTPEVVSDLMANRVQWSIIPVPVAMPQIAAGKLRALSVQGPTRNSALPDLPTTTEAGYPNVGDGGWYVLLAPAGTPPEIVRKINAAAIAAVAKPNSADLFKIAGMVSSTSTPEEAGSFLRNQLTKWKKVARDAQISTASN